MFGGVAPLVAAVAPMAMDVAASNPKSSLGVGSVGLCLFVCVACMFTGLPLCCCIFFWCWCCGIGVFSDDDDEE